MEIIVLLIFAIIKYLSNREEKKKDIPKAINIDMDEIENIPIEKKEKKSIETIGKKIPNLLTDLNTLIEEFEEKQNTMIRKVLKEKPNTIMMMDSDEVLNISDNNPQIYEYNNYIVEERKKVKNIDNIKDEIKDRIKDEEIKDGMNDYDISFTRESLIQAIIMSEILDKPKALRR
ncbi:MAG: hypothetical protein GX214_05355 [Clostridiales bacterium]|nr:hypothetical protein [Clostridiales bacterium]